MSRAPGDMAGERGTFTFAVNNFDLVRLLAAFQVLMVHGSEHLHVGGLTHTTKVLELFPGVPIFFVTSGYLISGSLERSPGLAGYFRNRFLRIYPALWACLVVSIATVVIFYEHSILSSAMLPWLAAQVTIGQFYNPDILRGYGVGTLNGSLWTIPVELQFYLFLPFIYPLLRRAFETAWVAALVITMLVAANVGYSEVMTRESVAFKLVGVSLIPYLCMFLLGVYLQRRQDLVARWMNGTFLYWLAAVLMCALVGSSLGFSVGGNYLNPVSMIVLAGFTLASAYSRPRSRAGCCVATIYRTACTSITW